jgi:hypothetical protein
VVVCGNHPDDDARDSEDDNDDADLDQKSITALALLHLLTKCRGLRAGVISLFISRCRLGIGHVNPQL